MDTNQIANTLIVDIPITRETYLNRFLASINGLLKLSDKELQVLAAFMKLYEPNLQDVCHKEARRQVQKDLGFPTKAALNNYIKFLRDKGVFIHTPKPTSSYTFHPLVQGGVDGAEEIRIKLQLAPGS